MGRQGSGDTKLRPVVGRTGVITMDMDAVRLMAMSHLGDAQPGGLSVVRTCCVC